MTAETVISFASSSLKQEDLETLGPDEWLNDSILAFWFELIEAQLSPSLKEETRLWPPSIVELLCSVEDGIEASSMFPPPGNIIFLPINDRYADASGGGIGSHWSLLVVTDGKTPSKIRARHYDSLSAQNEKAARRVWKKYSALIGAKEGSSEEGFEEANELQAQDNACDCGLYGLVLAERMLLSRGSAAHSIGKMVAKKVSPKHVEKFREVLRKWLVQKWLRFDVEEQERWKSWEDVVQHVGDMPRVDV